MSKRKSISKFIIVSIIVLLGLLLSFLKCDIPFTTYTYNGFLSSISTSAEISGGAYITYMTEDNNRGSYSDDVKTAGEYFEKLLNVAGYDNVNVTIFNKNQISLTVAGVTSGNELSSVIGSPSKIQISSSEDKTVTAELTGKHVSSAQAAYNNQSGSYGVSLKFNDEGAKIFEDMTGTAAENSSSIYLTVGESTSTLSVGEKISGGETFISGNFDNFNDAEVYANNILLGSLELNLKEIDNNTISPIFGEHTDLLLSLAGLAIIIIIIALFFVLFKELGLIVMLNTIIYTVLMLFFLQAVPVVYVTMSGVSAILISYLIYVFCTMLYLNKVKSEFALGKKMPTAFKTGFKSVLPVIADINIFTFIFSLVMYFLGGYAEKSFAFIILISSFVCAFCLLVCLRGFNNWYINTNSTNYKKVGFTKEASINEED